jgi:RNA 2',3'-cyclic 3'-phosphodiesterase
MRQMTLAGIESPGRRELHNLFFALWPGEEVRAGIAAEARQLKHDHAPQGRWFDPRRYHVTMRYLGAHAALPPHLVSVALAAGDAVRVPPFDLTLDIAGSFANKSVPWWLGCKADSAGVGALSNAIADAFRAQGAHVAGSTRIVPHVTVLRDADRALPATPIAPIQWPVDAFVLIDSLLGPQSGYTVLRTWKLRG